MIRLFFLAIFLILSNLSYCQSPNKIAPKILDKYFRFSCDTTNTVYSGKVSGELGKYTVWQFKGFTWNLESEEVTERDSLNGIDWKGQINIHAKYFRKYRIYGSDVTGSGLDFCGYWYAWEMMPESGLFIRLKRQNGDWKDFEVDGSYWTYIPAGDTTKLSCYLVNNLKDDVAKRIKVWGK